MSSWLLRGRQRALASAAFLMTAPPRWKAPSLQLRRLCKRSQILQRFVGGQDCGEQL